ARLAPRSVISPALGQGEALAVGVLDRDVSTAPLGSRVAHGQPDDLVLVVVVADDHVDAVAVRALLGSTPAAELVGCRSDRAVALAGGMLDLEPALASFAPANRVIVDRRVAAEVHAADLLADTGKRRADLVGSWNLRFHTFFLSLKRRFGETGRNKKP